MIEHNLQRALFSDHIAITGISAYALACMVILVLTFPSTAIGQASGDGIRYVSQFGSDSNNGLTWSAAKATLAGAQTSCPSSGSCVIHVSAAGLTLSANFTLSRPETTVTCEPGAVIVTAVSGLTPIVISANDTQVSQCVFDYSSGSTDAISIPNTVSHVVLDHNTFENFPSGGANSAIYVGDRSNKTSSQAVTDISVTDNFFLNNTGINVNIQDYVERVIVARNRIFTGTLDVNNPLVNAQTSDNLTTIRGLSVSNNMMASGMGADCIQIQQLSGTAIEDVTVSSNICTLRSEAAGGTGYSMAGINGLSFVGNTFDTNGQTFAGINAPFEFVNVQNGTESGNSAVLGIQSGNPGYIFTVIGNGGSSLNDAFTGNSGSISYAGTQIAGCWNAGVSVAISSVSRNIFSGNTCDFTGSTGKVVGFFLQSNNSTATVNNNFVTENNFIGTNVTGDAGICIEPDLGTMLHNVVGPNNLFNFHLPYCHNLGAQSSGLLLSTLDNLTYGSPLSGPNAH